MVAALYAVYSRAAPGRLAAGLGVALAGLLLRAWAAGHLEKNQALATGGPFAYTRNPLYLGTLLCGAGFALAGGRWWLAAVLAVFFVAAYLPAISEEENHLSKLFPDYAGYAAQVPRFLPRLTVAYATGRFRWELYVRNREYQALAAYLLVAAWLAGKLWWG